jgi:cyclohexyl-isocyanide hydratase
MEPAMSAPSLHFGFLLFPRVTQLDLTGPVQVLSRVPGAQVHLVWKDRAPVVTDAGFAIVPTDDFATCPPLDLICVPGGFGTDALLTDAETLAFVRARAAQARYVTSVCTGSLVLGAAGLLKGKRAACHWSARDLLAQLGAIPSDARVETDGNVITGGGVTAGIDFALTVAAALAGREVAEMIQLAIEYAPHPPFTAGSPETAPPAVVARYREATKAARQGREAAVAAAAAALG